MAYRRIVHSCIPASVVKRAREFVKIVACVGHNVQVRPHTLPCDQLIQIPSKIVAAGSNAAAMPAEDEEGQVRIEQEIEDVRMKPFTAIGFESFLTHQV